MNRDIKFRAWHKYAEKIADVIAFNNMHCDDEYDYKYVVTLLSVENHEHVWKYRDIVLMQFTGLYDKKSKRIFEGDIVKVIQIETVYETKRVECIYAVETHEGIWNVSPMWIEAKFGYNASEGCCCKVISIEVIGNIYEHKNLIK